MGNLNYEQLFSAMDWGYFNFTLESRRFRSLRLHLGEEVITDENSDSHYFDIIWFKDTEELVAVEVEESLGVVLPLNFRLKKSTEKYLFLGTFTEKGIDDLLVYRGGIIKYLWRSQIGG